MLTRQVENLSDFFPADDFKNLEYMNDDGFVIEAYRRILHRDPDASGLSTHKDFLLEGAGRQSLVMELLRSEESCNWLTVNQILSVDEIHNIIAQEGEAFVSAAYAEILKRTPDLSGLNFHTDALRQGRSKIGILADLAVSEEGLQHWGANRASIYYPSVHSRTTLDRLKRLITGRGQEALPILDRVLKSPISLHVSQAETADAIHKAPWDQSVLEQERRIFSVREDGGVLWFDLTNPMLWRSSVVGIIRSELEVAAAIKKINPKVRYCMHLGNGFIEIADDRLSWLFEAENVADTYARQLGRKIGEMDEKPAYVHLGIEAPDFLNLFHPFEPGDIFYSMGWIDTNKESCLTQIRAQIPSLYISYLIYDIIVVGTATRHFYPEFLQDKFDKYINWISENCNLICYLGKTAQRDTEAYFKDRDWRVPPGVPIYFGTDFVKDHSHRSSDDLLAEMGVQKPFVMTVGSLEPRKNHETLYKAYLIALEKDPENTPQLIMVGRPVERVGNLIDKIERNPKVKNKIKILRPTDEQLVALYNECLFTLLPSVYEGWSLTLAESLGQGKFCLTCKTPPLMEVGQDLVEYFEPYDVEAWAAAIIKYTKSPAARAKWEKSIKSKWKMITWRDTAQQIVNTMQEKVLNLPAMPPAKPEIWYDLTLTFLLWGGGLSGIPRAELVFAKYMKQAYPNVHYFAYHHGAVFEIEHGKLEWLFKDGDIHVQYRHFREFWAEAESSGAGARSPFFNSNIDIGNHPENIKKIPDNSIVVFTGIDFSVKEIKEPGEILSSVEYLHRLSLNSYNVTLAQLIYDFTPFIIPHCHIPQTVAGYEPFIKFVSNHFDFLIYGGRTAQKDGLSIQKKYDWKSPSSAFIEFGSNLETKAAISRKRDKELLLKHGINRPFIITVGTIEPRKNHEMLYKAYLMLQERGEVLPHMIFVGKPGWLTEDFLETLNADQRIKNDIFLMSPDDEFLDVLYRNCLFTVLPSIYEGWSLTLPESLSYGKFCLTADTPPLVETGRDLVEYVSPYDTMAWAERIFHYYKNPQEVAVWERKIKQGWHVKSWDKCAQDLLGLVLEYHMNRYFSSDAAKLK